MHNPLDAYLEHLRCERQVSAHTCSAYRLDLGKVLDYCQQEQLADWRALDTPGLRRLIARLHQQGLSGKSLARLLSAVRGFYQYLNRQGLCSHDPANGLTPPKGERRLPKTLDADRAKQLLDGHVEDDFLGHRDQALLELCYSSGLRLAELVSLNTEQLDLSDGLVTVRGKGNKLRVVPIGSKARAALQLWLPLRALAKPQDDALFISQQGRRLGAGNVVNGVIADVYGLFGAHSGARQGVLERQWIGLADAQLLGTQGELEIVGQAQAAHIGVAVADHSQLVVIGQVFQGRLHLGKQADLVARFEKYLEAGFGQWLGLMLGITGLLQGEQENPSAQRTEAMLEAWLGGQQAGADRPQVFDGHAAELRRMAGQPVAQGVFRAVHYAGDIPQGVVEVEGDQLNAHSSLLVGRLARGRLPLPGNGLSASTASLEVRRLARGWALS